MKSYTDAVGLALQISFEYPDWGDEHISEMLQTYKHTGEPVPCNYTELQDLAVKADRLKREGKSYNEAEKELLSLRKTKK